MSSGTDFKLIRRRSAKSPSKLAKILLWMKFYGFWKLKHYYKVCTTVAQMLIKRETRLYFMYSTGQVVTVTAFNYAQLVKTDGDEFAIIKFETKSGVIYSKCERF